MYKLQNNKEFIPEITEETRIIYNFLKKEFPYTNICIWELNSLNEFSIHQFPIDIVFVESEYETELAIFEVLKEYRNNFNIIYKPARNFDLNIYIDKTKRNLIIKRLVSEAPIKQSEKMIFPKLEKILVDILSKDFAFKIYDMEEIKNIFINAFNFYNINFNTLKRYARRRSKELEVFNLLNNLNIKYKKMVNNLD